VRSFPQVAGYKSASQAGDGHAPGVTDTLSSDLLPVGGLGTEVRS
jgi:hypothetical protein